MIVETNFQRSFGLVAGFIIIFQQSVLLHFLNNLCVQNNVATMC